ncbi:transcriptional regulator [Candidatus Pyrohabitans sp.]
MQERLNLFLRVLEIFEKRGFEISEACILSNACFDFFARQGGKLLLVKVLANIDSLTDTQAKDIVKVAATLGAAPVIVGEKKTTEALQEGVVYLRHGLACVSEQTLENALDSEYPALLCYRGGYYASIDGTLLKNLRKAHNLSRPALAKQVGLSPKAIYRYEEEETSATFETAFKLEEFFSTPLVKPLNIFRVPGLGECGSPAANLAVLRSLGFEVYPVRKAPFSALTKSREAVLLAKAARCCSREVMERAKILRSIAETVNRGAFILLDSGRVKNISGVATIARRELEELQDARHLLELIEERATQDQGAGV